jgi:asparagine synthase (glutamine-hydrolysing)
MEKRYFIAFGPQADVARADFPLPHDLIPKNIGAGLTVWTNDRTPLQVSPPGDGLLIGELFDAAGLSVSLSPDQWQRARRSGGSSLASGFWGNWVACLQAPNSTEWTLVRDPAGGLGCYYMSEGGQFVAGTSVCDLLDYLDLRPSIHWPAIAAHIHRASHRTQETALCGIRELLPGHSLRPVGGGDQPFWSPWDFCNEVDETSPLDLSAIVDRVIHAHAGGADKLLLNLSGGLDSSIVAASLAATRASISCLTLATSSPEGDERHYARAVAQHLGMQLETWFYNLDEIDLNEITVSRTARPTGRIYARGADRARRDLARNIGAAAIFAGDGGDNVFCFLQSATPLVDRFLAHGLHAGLGETLRDLSRLTRCSAPVILRKSISKMARGGRYRWPVNDRFLSGEALRLAWQQPWHPWLSSPRGMLPGKVSHVAQLARAQSYADTHSDGASHYVYPLLAQPVVEHCLRIPTWAWCRGGRNRSIARDAFQGRLPVAVLDRPTKGGPDGFCIRLVERNLPKVKEMLLDGQLAKNGMLDMLALEACFSAASRSSEDTHRLMELVDAESWASGWLYGSRRMS